MIEKRLLDVHRVRRIDGGFSFIPHRFLSDGFVSALDPGQLLLYFFLVIAGDRNGVSFYGYDSICSLLQMSVDDYIAARNGLVKKNLIAFDGTLFQVLALPETAPVEGKKAPVPGLKQLIESVARTVPS